MNKRLLIGLLTFIQVVSVVPAEAQSDLVVTKTAPGDVMAGQNLTYNIAVENIGLSSASSVELSDTLPPNTTFVSATQTSGPNFFLTKPAVGATGTVKASKSSLSGFAILRDPLYFTVVGDSLFFTAEAYNYGRELWKTDGTPEGTVLVKDISPTISNVGFPRILTNVNGTLFFNSFHPDHGEELWKSDGTEAGTVLVKDITPGTSGSFPNYLVDVNGTLFFSASDGVNGRELWKSDGTPAGTVLVKDIHPTGSSNPLSLANFGGMLFFAANNGTNGIELWKSDGTPEGTVMVKDSQPGPSGAQPKSLTDVNGTLFYDYNYGLWKSDGTTAGTVLVKNYLLGISYSSYPENLIPIGSTLYFRVGERNGNRKELWKSDGTTAGTVFIKTIISDNTSITPQDFTNVGSTLFFRADDATHGAELWKSDGTSEGTVLVKDINPDAANSLPQYLTNVNGTLFFSANDGTSNYELWKSDGTLEGTVLVKEINPGTTGSHPRYLINCNGTLFFEANDGVHGREVWKSDGTPEGTVPLRGSTPNKATFEIVVNVNSNATGSISNTATVSTASTESDITNNTSTATTRVVALPRVNISDAVVTEGPAQGAPAGTVDATFAVTLSTASGQTVTVNAIPSNGSAKAPGDYTSGGTTITFAPGETVKTFSVPVKGDLLDEADEVFYVLLSSPVNAAIARGRGIGTIQDDDAAPSITIEDLAIGEGNSGQRVAAFRLSLSAPSGQLVKVSYETAGGINHPATASNDYTAVAPTQIAFTTGQTVVLARVLINGDALNEPNETFLLNLAAPVNATLADNQASGTILNDDSAPAITINDVVITEGNAGTKQVTFTGTLSKPIGQTVTVNYASADGGAKAGSDYAAQSGTLSFAPGQTTQSISIAINGDTLAEPNEVFYLILSGAINAAIGRGRAIGTITNDDASG